MSNKESTLAFFDFDGTITRTDSLKHFLWFYFSPGKFLIRFLKFLPVFLAYAFKVIDNSTAKEKLFKIYFADEPIAHFEQKCAQFANHVIPKLIKNEALNKLHWHLREGHEVAIVSASISNYLEPYFKDFQAIVIATELEVKNEKLTGNFLSPNCHGKEKCNRILSKYNLEQYREIYVYGDSKGDREMFELATKRYLRKFN